MRQVSPYVSYVLNFSKKCVNMGYIEKIAICIVKNFIGHASTALYTQNKHGTETSLLFSFIEIHRFHCELKAILSATVCYRACLGGNYRRGHHYCVSNGYRGNKNCDGYIITVTEA
jgi:hypothetical protein